jgi:hypothetical protein
MNPAVLADVVMNGVSEFRLRRPRGSVQIGRQLGIPVHVLRVSGLDGVSRSIQ